MRGPAAFEAVFRRGRRFDSPHLQVVTLPVDASPGRCGFVISAKLVKRAVQRNRIRRMMREVLRARRARLEGQDVVIRLRRIDACAGVAALRTEFENLLARL